MKTPATGRNDPCPCGSGSGSGKKFKHCCLGKDSNTAAGHGAAGMSERLRKALEGQQFNSQEEAQAFLDQISITQEKQQRVTEQLLTLITPKQWMDGKIASITLHCLKGILTILIIMLLVSTTTSAISGKPVFIPSAGLVPALNAALFILLGLLMINGFLAGFSATIDDPNHSSRTSFLMLPGLLVAAGFSVMGDPHSLFSQILSIFPLTSFAVMPIRVINGGVPWWQWLLSLFLLLTTVWLMRTLAVRLFTLGIRMYGKEPGWKEIGAAFLGR